MSLNKQIILGIGITTDSKETILEELNKWLSAKEKKSQKVSYIVTPNPEQMVLATKDIAFRDMINQADVAIPDGIGIVLASRLTEKNLLKQRIPGVELMEDLAAMAASRGYRIGLIGGRAGLAVKALECLQARYPKLSGWADDGPELIGETFVSMQSPEAGYWHRLAEKIRKEQTQMVFVGLGAPKQEYLIAGLRSWFMVHGKKKQGKNTMNNELSTINCPLILMSVGGSFEMISSLIQRAPKYVRLIGLEWLWRLLHEPWRFRRQLALMKFVFLVFKEKVSTA